MSATAPETAASPPAQEDAPAKTRFRLGTYGWLAVCFWLAGLWFLVSGATLYSRAGRIESGAADASELARSASRLGFGEAFISQVPDIGPEAPPAFADRARLRLAQGIRAHARSSTVFGIFCVIVGGFWFGFGRLDPFVSGRCDCR